MKKRLNKKIKIIIIIAVVLAGILFGTAAFGYVYIFKGSNYNQSGEPQTSKTGEPIAKLDNRVSFLLVGADKRPGDNSYNADTIIVASVDPDTKIISMLSIPRDTRVTLAGSKSFVKINSVPMYRGIDELVSQVSDLTGIALDGYVLTNFEGFKSIIDTLGGVTIDVERDMGPFYTGDKVDGLIHLKKGEQRLMGSEALQYARWRNDATADIGRTARQQKVLKAIANEALQASTIIKLPTLISQMMDVVETDLNLKDMLKLSKVAASFESSNIVSLTMPGAAIYLDYLSYWEVNRTQAKEVAKNLLLGITTDKVIDNTVMSLLDPEIRAHITVPGSHKDPNGTESTGHDEQDGLPGSKENPEEQEGDPVTENDPPGTENEEEPNPDPDPGKDQEENPNPNPDSETDENASTEPDQDQEKKNSIKTTTSEIIINMGEKDIN